MSLRPPGHKNPTPKTLKEAIEFDQQRREAAYQEWLVNKQRFQEKQQEFQKVVDKF